MRFEGKVASITGGARGIGRAIAQGLASEGALVALGDIHLDEVSKTAREIEDAFGRQVVPFSLDVKKKANILSFVDGTMDAFGRIDMFCNNAGICSSPPIEEITEAAWDEMMDVNLKGVFLCCQAVMPIMKRQKHGSILNMASLAGKVGGLAAGAHYSASKAGVICLTKSFARVLAPYGVTVNALAPGPVDTDMLQTLPPDRKELMKNQCPLERFAETVDIAGAALFLLSDAARHITGTTLNVNGGLLME